MRHHLPQRDRGWEISRRDYEQLASPQQIADKILYGHELFGHQRFLAQIDIGGLPYAKVAQVIELLACEVLPIVKRALGDQGNSGSGDTSPSR